MRYLLSVLIVFMLILGSSCSSGGNETESPKQSITLDVNGEAIKIEPGPGSILYSAQGESSEVLLKDVKIARGVADRDYHAWEPSSDQVKTGETILVINGTVQNKHKKNTHITMWARGFDKTGEQVVWTLDAAHIIGQIGLQLEKGQTGEFILHLNLSENIDTIHIYAGNYSITPP